MQTHLTGPAETPSDFDAALRQTAAIADKSGRERDLESPAHASECHEGCATRGCWNYALNRGGALAVDFDARQAGVALASPGLPAIVARR